MGGFDNLFKDTSVDISVDVFGEGDKANTIRLGIFWALVSYAIAMIWSTTLLVDRWRGPHGKSPVGAASVLVAIFLSVAWPVVFVYLMMSV